MTAGKYIWEKPGWPNFHWDDKALLPLYGQVCRQQGELLAQVKNLGLAGSETYRQIHLEIMVDEAVKSSAVEGVAVNPEAVRSSLARRLGLPTAGIPEVLDRYADGVVAVLLDATENYREPLTDQRLWSWQAAMFPGGYSGLNPIRVGAYRSEEDGPMRVVSGPLNRPKAHFVAPPGALVAAEMGKFLKWWAASRIERPDILRAGLAHLWFVIIHPFADGNGRIGRALAEMALAQAENEPARFYSLSAEIMRDRKSYYDILEITNRGDGDITEWQLWFLAVIGKALEQSRQVIDKVMTRVRFWLASGQIAMNDRQRKVVSRMLEGFEGGMTTRKYKGIAHTSPATAQRELADLVSKGLLIQTPGSAGRSVSYLLNSELTGLKD